MNEVNVYSRCSSANLTDCCCNWLFYRSLLKYDLKLTIDGTMGSVDVRLHFLQHSKCLCLQRWSG